MNSPQFTTLAITTVVIAQVLFATVGLAKFYDPTTEVPVGARHLLATTPATVSTVAWMLP